MLKSSSQAVKCVVPYNQCSFIGQCKPNIKFEFWNCQQITWLDKPRFRTNIGKQTTSAMATEMWQQLPTHVKNFSTHNFPKKLKEYLLAEQLTY